MKRTKNISSYVICLLMLLCYHLKAQNPPVVMQWGTHLDIKRNTSTSNDWCYAIKETSDGGFISCGS